MGVGNFINPFDEYGDIFILDYTDLLKNGSSQLGNELMDVWPTLSDNDRLSYLEDAIMDEFSYLMETDPKARSINETDWDLGMTHIGNFGGGFGALSLYMTRYYGNEFIVGCALNSTLRDFLSNNNRDDISKRDYASAFKAKFSMPPSELIPRVERGLALVREFLIHSFAITGFEVRKATTAYSTADITPENTASSIHTRRLAYKISTWDQALAVAFDTSTASTRKSKPRF